MKLGLIAVSLIVLAGCAGNQGLRSQVDTLQKQSHSQDEQIANLKAELAKKEEASKSSLSTAWDWTSQHAQDAWNSQTSQEARARFQKCWDDLNTSQKK